MLGPRCARCTPVVILEVSVKQIRVGHSPDADDAFMFYAIAHRRVELGQYELVDVVEDIESLNRRALKGELEATAISAAVYPQVANDYRILSCGGSIGRAYGPIVVARQAMSPEDLEGKRVAIPGRYTTAYLLFQIFAPLCRAVPMDFDAIMGAVQSGQVEAGVIIHEGQITYEDMGLVKVLDLGEAWDKATGLPIPLGVDVVNRTLGEEAIEDVYGILHDAIRYALDHEDEALDYAMQFGRGVDKETCRRFVRMYVNQDTEQMGPEGLKALETMYQLASDKGLISATPPLDIVGLK
jgi:1,4-dihydroxy-6-naphthoate synthase